MRRRACLAALLAGLCAGPACAATEVLIVTGLGGELLYSEQFRDQSAAIAAAAGTLPGDVRVTTLADATAVRESIGAWFDGVGTPDALLVFLIGHGSYDDTEFKFNVQGPDVTDTDLRDWLDGAAAGTQLVVFTGSASGAASETLAGERRIVITATRSGRERHATLFGNYFAAALSDPSADRDKNRRISAGEAFEFATRAVADAFEEAGQLATEHARLEGERADRLTLARLDAAAPAGDDPELARLRAVRDRISDEIEALQLTRGSTPDALYRSELTRLLVDLAEAEEAIEAYVAATN